MNISQTSVARLLSPQDARQMMEGRTWGQRIQEQELQHPAPPVSPDLITPFEEGRLDVYA